MIIDLFENYFDSLVNGGTTVLISFLFGLIWNNHRREKNLEKNLKLGVLTLLRSEIIKEHAKCKKNGVCSMYSIELVSDVYESYHELGGNGTATKLVEDIRNLPVENLEQEFLNIKSK